MTMPVTVTCSASSPGDGVGEDAYARVAWTAFGLRFAKVVKAAMHDAASVSGRAVIRHEYPRRAFSGDGGALRLRAGRGEPETAALAVLIDIPSATGPRYHLV